jgi:hypothetical protein
MFRIIFGIFVGLHGLVHLLYFGQSQRIFELRPGMVWPDGAWAFSSLLGNQTTRGLAGILLVLAAIGFVAGGSGLIAKQTWGRSVVVGVAIFSSVLYLLFWDGVWQNLDDKGGIAILINVAILIALLLFQWPSPGIGNQ